jgi:hypothetical protein
VASLKIQNLWTTLVVGLLRSFEQLKIPIISDSSEVHWIPDEIGRGDSSVVKLSLNSKTAIDSRENIIQSNICGMD